LIFSGWVLKLSGDFSHGLEPANVRREGRELAAMNLKAAKILCVELDEAVLESRCAVLKHSGYNSVSASPQLAEILLCSQKFDLIVLSSTVSDYDLQRIVNLSDGADVLALDGFTMPSQLLFLVEDRLNNRQRRA
jgi:hypothetical protein